MPGYREGRPKPLILHIDDMKEVLLSTQPMIEALGADALSADTAAEGMRLARMRLPDLILMDVQMPQTSGHEATKTLRNEPTTRDIPILMVTGADTKRDVEKALAAGANGYVIKPLHIDRLKKAVGEWIQLP